MTAGTVPSRRVGATERRDRWWLAPLLTAIGLTAFGIYALVAAAMGTDYVYTEGGAQYLSPLYSPDLERWGLHLPFTYACFVIWVPLGFRLTCYYYRKAYVLDRRVPCVALADRQADARATRPTAAPGGAVSPRRPISRGATPASYFPRINPVGR